MKMATKKNKFPLWLLFGGLFLLFRKKSQSATESPVTLWYISNNEPQFVGYVSHIGENKVSDIIGTEVIPVDFVRTKDANLTQWPNAVWFWDMAKQQPKPKVELKPQYVVEATGMPDTFINNMWYFVIKK